MRFIQLILSCLCLLKVANAHGDGGVIEAFGMGKLGHNLARSAGIFDGPERYFERDVGERVRPWPLSERAANMRCGYVNGTCPTGYCCSIGGFCGKNYHYCSGPACQLSYGDACDGNRSPDGASTINISRPLLGNVTYGGVGIYKCSKSNTVALTFDDGPYIFTSDLLDVLDKYNAKATFFITGNNMGKGAIDVASTGYPQLLQRMHASGHQLASHSWTHQNLTNMTQEQKVNQIVYNEMAFRNVLGFFPTYFRPPYSECDNSTQALLGQLGYHILYFNIDSQDYLNDDPNLIQYAKDNITQQFDTVNVTAGYPADFIEISHDIHNQTVHNLTIWTLDDMLSRGYGTSVTVGECLEDAPENWYRSAGGAAADAVVNQKSLPSATPTEIGLSGPSATPTKKSAASREPDGSMILWMATFFVFAIRLGFGL